MTVDAGRAGGRYLRRRAFLDFDGQIQPVAAQDAAGEIVKMDRGHPVRAVEGAHNSLGRFLGDELQLGLIVMGVPKPQV